MTRSDVAFCTAPVASRAAALSEIARLEEERDAIPLRLWAVGEHELGTDNPTGLRRVAVLNQRIANLRRYLGGV